MESSELKSNSFYLGRTYRLKLLRDSLPELSEP